MSGRAGCAGAGSGNELDRPRHHAPLGLVELGLGPVQVDTWGPFVFVNADLDAPPLADSLGALPALIEPDALVFRERVRPSWPRTGRSPSRTTSSATTARPPTGGSALSSTSTRTRTGSRLRTECSASSGIAAAAARAQTTASSTSCGRHSRWSSTRARPLAGPGVA